MSAVGVSSAQLSLGGWILQQAELTGMHLGDSENANHIKETSNMLFIIDLKSFLLVGYSNANGHFKFSQFVS